jgi:hypothetical protein
MSIIINVNQSPLTITPSNAEHIYTLSSTGYTLSNFKYLVDIYFKPQGLNEQLVSRLKVAPNTYGKAIMDVSEIIRTFLNGNPRFSGQTYPYLNYVADENSVITLADAQTTREYNGHNLWFSGTPNANLTQLWHVAQYRCVVGCEYTSGSSIVTDIVLNASYQPDYVTIFPGVDNSLIPEPFLPYGTLGSGYTGSANFFQVDNQGWYYYDLFRHVYQRPGATECRNYTYNNVTGLPIQITYNTCDYVQETIVVSATSSTTFCALEGTIVINYSGCTCDSYEIENNLIMSATVFWTDCSGNIQSTILTSSEGIQTCACNGSVYSEPAGVTITNLGNCGGCICKAYDVVNDGIMSGTTIWTDCDGILRSRILASLEGFSTCACEGSIYSDEVPLTITDLGYCYTDNTLTDNGLCEGYNPVKECPGPQEFTNAAGQTDCVVTQADGQSFTNVRRRMHHPDCPMIVSFLNGKNDYFTNDIYSIAVRGALNHGDPYTYSAECQNRTSTPIPTVEEPVNSTFKMLNFYLPYNVTSGNTLNAIPTNAQKVCFYGTSYDSNRNNRLNMASATTEILEYWIQPYDCINEPVHILFMNGRGMWDTYTFGKKNTKKITLERKKYQQESSLDKQFYARGSSDRGQKIFEQNASYSWDCNTWFMDQADTTIMEEIFMSQDVFIITGTTIPAQYCQSCLNEIRLYQHLIPVIVKQTDFVEYQKQYQKIYQYNLTLEFGSVKRFRTQG